MKKDLFYSFSDGKGLEILRKEFELSLQRRIAERIRRGFIKTYKPVMDDSPYRVFPRMKDYHRWCEEKLPRWLGYGKAG